MRALRRPPEDRDGVEATAVREYLIFSNPAVAERYREVQLLETERGLLDASIPRVVTTVSVEPAQTRILPRGNWMDESAPIVEPAIPRFLGKLDTKGERATRLDLANWLVSRDNPLTARVFVNRTWREFFGTGLSKVLDDLGSQGEWPTHPELLDWLAAEFMHRSSTPSRTHDWDVKHIIRSIVTSHTYRQSSLRRRRRSTNAIRRTGCSRVRAASASTPRTCATSRLHVSGLLVEKFGGPSVKPVSAGRLSGRAELSEARILGEPRRRPVPPRRLHDLAAHVPASEPAELRRADARGVHGQPQHVEHAAAGAGAAQRSDLRRSRARVRRRHALAATAARASTRSSTGSSTRAESRADRRRARAFCAACTNAA